MSGQAGDLFNGDSLSGELFAASPSCCKSNQQNKAPVSPVNGLLNRGPLDGVSNSGFLSEGPLGLLPSKMFIVLAKNKSKRESILCALYNYKMGGINIPDQLRSLYKIQQKAFQNWWQLAIGCWTMLLSMPFK